MPKTLLNDGDSRAMLTLEDDHRTLKLFGHVVVANVASGRALAQAAAIAALATYFVPSEGGDRSFEVGANVLVLTATTHAFTMTVAYTDEGGTARTLTMTFGLVAGGAAVTSIANGNGAVPYHGFSGRIRAKAGTLITVATTGTFTTVSYNAEAVIRIVGA